MAKNANASGTIRKKTVSRNGKEYTYWKLATPWQRSSCPVAVAAVFVMDPLGDLLLHQAHATHARAAAGAESWFSPYA